MYNESKSIFAQIVLQHLIAYSESRKHLCPALGPKTLITLLRLSTKNRSRCCLVRRHRRDGATALARSQKNLACPALSFSHFFNVHTDTCSLLCVQNPDFFPIVVKKIQEEGVNGNKAFFYTIRDPEKGLRKGAGSAQPSVECFFLLYCKYLIIVIGHGVK